MCPCWWSRHTLVLLRSTDHDSMYSGRGCVVFKGAVTPKGAGNEGSERSLPAPTLEPQWCQARRNSSVCDTCAPGSAVSLLSGLVGRRRTHMHACMCVLCAASCHGHPGMLGNTRRCITLLSMHKVVNRLCRRRCASRVADGGLAKGCSDPWEGHGPSCGVACWAWCMCTLKDVGTHASGRVSSLWIAV
jgi:hypothetical protein